MIFVDSHCHLNLLEGNPVDTIKRAFDSGVTRIIVPGIDLATSLIAIDLADEFPAVYAAVGIHPHEASKVSTNDILEITKLASHPKVVAIGEIGLDYHYPPFDMDLQKVVLIAMLDLAKSTGKPVILHSRDSLADLISIVAIQENLSDSEQPKHDRLCGVFHMFEGNTQDALTIVNAGFLFSIGGNITFKNNQRGTDLVENLGLTHLLLETDSPYISPHPYRGTPNEPGRIPIIAAKIAEIHQSQVELVAEITTRNATSLFKLE